MRVICDDCPCCNESDGHLDCLLKYEISRGEYGKKTYSDSCRLVKIVTLDGEIYPEPEDKNS